MEIDLLPSMKLLNSAVSVAVAAGLLSGCATPSVSSPQLQARLAPEWIASARRVRSGDRTVYFRGQAKGTTQAGDWTGTVRGDILVLDPAMAIVIPAGSARLTPEDGLKIDGPQHIVTSAAPAWRHLLRP